MDSEIEHLRRKVLSILAKAPVNLHKDELNNLEGKQGIYFIYYDDPKPVYIGITKTRDLKQRLLDLVRSSGAHTLKNKLNKDNKNVEEYLKQCKFNHEIIPDKNDRYRTEHFAIAVLNPKYND